MLRGSNYSLTGSEMVVDRHRLMAGKITERTKALTAWDSLRETDGQDPEQSKKYSVVTGISLVLHCSN